jgi:hypothetical protein
VLLRTAPAVCESDRVSRRPWNEGSASVGRERWRRPRPEARSGRARGAPSPPFVPSLRPENARATTGAPALLAIVRSGRVDTASRRARSRAKRNRPGQRAILSASAGRRVGPRMPRFVSRLRSTCKSRCSGACSRSSRACARSGTNGRLVPNGIEPGPESAYRLETPLREKRELLRCADAHPCPPFQLVVGPSSPTPSSRGPVGAASAGQPEQARRIESMHGEPAVRSIADKG